MKTRLVILRWNTFWILTVISGISAAPLSCADDAGQKVVDETRQSLRQHGFKTDLADFDFSTSPDLRAREAILKAAFPVQPSNQVATLPNLMETVGSNSAVAVLKLNSLKVPYTPSLTSYLASKKGHPISWREMNNEITWDEFRKADGTSQLRIDDACAAILSGPIRFNLDAARGHFMLRPYLPMVRYLTDVLEGRTLLALHDGDFGAAWTNLMAATRLVTAWEPDGAEASHLDSFSETSRAFAATWQALQTNGWPDDQLARLQMEWESADFFTRLPETAAFKRASYVALCQQERQGLLNRRLTFTEFLKAAFQFPLFIWYELNVRWNQANYAKRGGYEDEKALLLFYRDRELEIRSASQAPTWSAMRRLPGVTNIPGFHSTNESPMQGMMYAREIRFQGRMQNEDSTLLGAAAMAESQRRLIIAAIALERYRGKHGSYPGTLSELAPEFLKSPPLDFIDGQPLRYHSTDDGHFLLYSIGLDCVDHGGQFPPRQRQPWTPPSLSAFAPLSEGDVIWPLPASSAAVKAFRTEETKTHRQGGRRYFRERN